MHVDQHSQADRYMRLLWAAQTWTQNPSYGCANKSKVLLGPTTYLKKKNEFTYDHSQKYSQSQKH